MDNLIANRIMDTDLSVHDWYRFVLSFPPHLVREYLHKFEAAPGDTVLDPFCGTGTTNIECKKLGIPSIGVEANPMTYFASCVKSEWNVDYAQMYRQAQQIGENARKAMARIKGPLTLNEEQFKLIPKGSISERPLSKTLILKKAIEDYRSPYKDYYFLALAKHIVNSYSNLKFGPEIGIRRKKITDVDVLPLWLNQIETMRDDLENNRKNRATPCVILPGDSRDISELPLPSKVKFVITSPPYPNEKDYSRTTRLESVILGFIKDRDELREIKKSFIRSNTKNVYKGDRDDEYIRSFETIMNLSKSVEDRRLQLGKKSGFEKLYSTVVQLYFGGMAKHLDELRSCLLPGAKLAYVVGDQASYFQIPIKTAVLLGEIAEKLGYRVEAIETFRSRFSTSTCERINEEVLVLSYQ